MGAGVALGKLLPGFTDAIRRLEFGAGSQINVAIAVLIWLMVYPMMLKIDFSSIVAVRERPRGILVILFVNWLVKPFSMAAIGYLFSESCSNPGSVPSSPTSTSPARSFSRRHPVRPWSSSGPT